MQSNPVSSIRGIGAKLAPKLHKKGIRTVADLLLHVPRDYQDRRSRTFIRDISESECLVQGEITEVEMNRSGSRGLIVHFKDESGSAKMRLLHYSPYQSNQLEIGRWLYVYGKAGFARTFFHPEYRVFSENPGEPNPEFRAIYSSTANITSQRIGLWIRDCMPQVAFFPTLQHEDQTLAEAVRAVHYPDPDEHPQATQKALDRVKFDEMLAFTLMRKRRYLERERVTTHELPKKSNLVEDYIDSLGFTLTAAQQRVIKEVLNDLDQKTAMRRLLQGDVGSGKTVIAAAAALRAAENGTQTAIMAPTELLAEQHYQVFSEWLTPLGIQVAVQTSRMAKRERDRHQESIKEGKALVAVGTHALFQGRTQFHNLGLTVIDEQHRFGVHQRMELVKKGQHAHELVLTATPIPRTLALAMFSDLAVSTLDELPPNRTRIITTSHPMDRREEVISAIERQLRSGRQVYWVCVAIEENEESELTASTTTFEELSNRFDHLGVGHVTGRMKVKEKSEAMKSFRDGEIRLLVATTVIEVGIDVPNATVMVIENAERLGLSQLHQLRGRVGRGSEQSHCLLIYQTPMSSNSESRIQAMRESTDGFELAETDLKNRGMGQVLGTLQSGQDHFKIANITDFIDNNQELNKLSDQLLKNDPDLANEIISTWSSDEQGYVAS